MTRFTKENTKGEKNPFFGRTHTSESRLKIGAASRGRRTFLGRYHTEATKRKIGEKNSRLRLGTKHSPESIEKMRIASARSVAKRKGVPLSHEHRKKLSDAHLRNGDRPPVGFLEKNPNWKGGISYKIACRLTLERDDYTCQICFVRDPDVMEVDHRLCRAVRPELAQDLSNLWTLCANCHRRKTKRDWEEIKKFRKAA